MIRDLRYEDESGDENTISNEIPKELRNLHTQTYDKSVSDLVSMMHDYDIILDPDYQRNYIWDNKRASLLVESILLNVPIPAIYVNEDEESRWVVVDGLQRLNTLRRFFDNEFKLVGLEVLSELNKLQYSTLNPKAKRLFNNGIIRTVLILQESHPEIKYDIFERLNRGAILLNSQELRNCLYRGDLNKLLKRLREDQVFLDCIGLKKPHKRFYDSELILRFFALSEAYNFKTGKLKGYPSKMKTFLNNYMRKKRKLSSSEKEEMEVRFIMTLEKVYYVFGAPAFRRVALDGNQDVRLNRALMDVIMASFSIIPFTEIKNHKRAIKKLYVKLPREDEDFYKAIIEGTSDTKKIEYRISTWMKNLRKIINK